VYEVVKKAMLGTIVMGTADVFDAKQGYVDFADKNPLYTNNVPADIRTKMADMMKKFRSGAATLAVPQM
jgi:hypothetical protein